MMPSHDIKSLLLFSVVSLPRFFLAASFTLPTQSNLPVPLRRTNDLFSSTTSSDVETVKAVNALPPLPKSTDIDHPLVQATHKFVYSQSGFYSPLDPSVFAEDFVFRGPYIGPLNKQDYMSTMNAFSIFKAFPDLNPNAFGYTLDPLDGNRVWFMVRNTGTFAGEPGLGLGRGIIIPPNGKKVQGCPETFSITFDDEGKVKYLSVGYVADRFEGNTEGKGAAVGLFKATGVPFPSPGPLLSFAQWFSTEVISAEDAPKSYSSENVPEWWLQKSTEKATEGYI